MIEPARPPITLGWVPAPGQRTASLTCALDPNAGARLAEARKAVTVAELVHRQLVSRASVTPLTVQLALDDLDAARARLAEVEASMVTITFDLRALERGRLDELAEAHPPTAKQIDHALAIGADVPTIDEDEHIPALLADAITRVTLSDDPANPLRGALSVDTMKDILAACSEADRKALGIAALLLIQSAMQTT